MDWAPDARARLQKVPFFIRPLVKKRAEAEALKRGLDQVTAALLDELKSKEHKG